MANGARQRELIVLSPGDHSQDCIARLEQAGWLPTVLPTPKAVARLLAATQRETHTGLLDLQDGTLLNDMEQLLPVLDRDRLIWVAVIAPGQLEDPGIRRLIREHCFDYITAPCPDQVMESVLGHAQGIALLCDDIEADEGSGKQFFHGMVGSSPRMQALYRTLQKAAPSEAPVFISGETGTGKELAASAIHALSSRASQPFIAINCGAIPPNLLQSELFGYERGAFTGANQRKPGRIELAHQGTLFLDEIGDLPLDSQASLLRFLQEGVIERLGGHETVAVDVRLISATHQDLERAVEEGRFRRDLYHRLCVIRVEQPPLRERGDDILYLAHHALREYGADSPRKLRGFSACAVMQMHAYAWPGNVRELLNRVRQAVVMTEGQRISAEDMSLCNELPRVVITLDEARDQAEKQAIEQAMRRNQRHMTRCAKELGVSRATLYRLVERHGLATRGEAQNEREARMPST